MDGISKLTPDAVKKITEKLSEMMGLEDTAQVSQLLRNERGELLNSEGLPIVDITEPITTTFEDTDVLLPEETDISPLPLSSLSRRERERLRQERDRILDQLEEEERLEPGGGERISFEERQEILRTRREAAASEKAKLQAVKEMEKKMGKALLRRMAEERTRENDPLISSSDDTKKPQNGKPIKKVTFADEPEEHASGQSSASPHDSADLGDLTLARLRYTGNPSLLSSSDKLPMKMVVVERKPDLPVQTTMVNEADSDDESNPESSEDEINNQIDSSDQELPLEDEEFDLDFVQHQREVALEYYARRKKIGAAALYAKDDLDEGTVSNVSSSLSKKPGLSQFKASRLASSYGVTPASSSPADENVITSAARVIQKSIRTGKLDAYDRLVGGDADSEDEIEGTQQLLELLREGEVYNLGPDVRTIPPTSGTPRLPTTQTSLSADKTSFKNLPPPDRSKVSKFKLSRAKAGRPSDAHTQQLGSESMARTNKDIHEPRSLVTSNQGVPATPSESATKIPSLNAYSIINQKILRDSNAFTPSMILESPSFPLPANAPTQTRLGSKGVEVLGTPTLHQHSSRPLRPPVVLSSAVHEFISATKNSNMSTRTKPEKVSRFMADRS